MDNNEQEGSTDIPIPSNDVLEIIFSTLEKPPQITFQYSNIEGFVVLPDAPTQQLKVTVQTKSSSLHLDLPCGIHSLSFCDKLISDLIRQQELACFKQPVDPVKDNAPNYYNIILHPMDLSTLQKNLRCGKIKSIPEFKENLDLVWNNCITFNGPDHPLTLLATSIKNAIQQVWDGSTIPPECDALQKLNEIKQSVDHLEESFKQICSIPSPIEFESPPIPIIRVQIEEKREEVKPPPVDLPPNQQERQEMAEILKTTPATKILHSWYTLRPYLTEDIVKNGVFSLNSIPNSILVTLKKQLLIH